MGRGSLSAPQVFLSVKVGMVLCAKSFRSSGRIK